MRVAVLGPICKDYIKIDNDLKLQIGGIPYYIAHTFRNLGIKEIVPFITFSEHDEEWVKNNFKDISFVHVPVEKTLEFSRFYHSNNPDLCVSIEIKYSPNVMFLDNKLLKNLDKFDYIIFSPLFNDNIPENVFKNLKHKNLILGNFGVFTYPDNGKFTQRSPEKLIKLLPYLKYLFFRFK